MDQPVPSRCPANPGRPLQPALASGSTDSTVGSSKLLGTTRDQFYEADYDAYAYARYIVYYLQEKGKLQDFYTKFLEDKKDLTGATALAAVLGEDLETFEPKWRKWVLAIPYTN